MKLKKKYKLNYNLLLKKKKYILIKQKKINKLFYIYFSNIKNIKNLNIKSKLFNIIINVILTINKKLNLIQKSIYIIYLYKIFLKKIIVDYDKFFLNFKKILFLFSYYKNYKNKILFIDNIGFQDNYLISKIEQQIINYY